jgi:hypothetical protein
MPTIESGRPHPPAGRSAWSLPHPDQLGVPSAATWSDNRFSIQHFGRSGGARLTRTPNQIIVKLKLANCAPISGLPEIGFFMVLQVGVKPDLQCGTPRRAFWYSRFTLRPYAVRARPLPVVATRHRSAIKGEDYAPALVLKYLLEASEQGRRRVDFSPAVARRQSRMRSQRPGQSARARGRLSPHRRGNPEDSEASGPGHGAGLC